MGKTSFGGPVYGAKSLLWSFFTPAQRSTGASTNLLDFHSIRVVPAYEDWYVTEMHVSASTNSSVAAAAGITLKTEGGSTTGIPRPDGVSTKAATLVAMTNPAGSTSWVGQSVITATAGEFEGAWVPAGSTLRLISSGVSILANVSVQVMGFIRYVSSTRAE